MNRVTVTVSGKVASGKSAICGEIEILCKALGLKVEWKAGQQEKNLTHADWTEALEMYKPEVVLVEQTEQPLPEKIAPRAQLDVALETLTDVLKGTTAHLASAISLLKRGSKKAAPSDIMFDMMISDYERSLNAARKVLDSSDQQTCVDAVLPEKIAPVQGYAPGIPWSLHLEAYDAYSKKWSPQPAMIDLEGRNCRGGFSTGELDQFIPGWRDRVSEIGKLRARVAELEAQIGTLAAPTPDASKE